ncbi:MAG: hypothetical protein ACLPJH_04225 [Myxococcaceae bacterium]
MLPQFQALRDNAAALAPRLFALTSQGGLAVTRPDGSTQPIPVGATPVVLAEKEVRARREVAARLASAGFKMAQAVVQSPERGWLLDSLGPVERRLVQEASPALFGLAIARVDFFAGHTLAALELNATIPAMPGYSDVAAAGYLEAAGELAGLDAGWRGHLKTLNGSNVAALYQALVDAFARVRGKGQPERMAVLCRRADAQLTEVAYLVERFGALGTETHLVYPDELSGSGAVLAQGRRFDCVYRHLFLRRLEDGTHPWLEAFFAAPQRFGAVLLNGPAAHVETKANFALLSRALVEPGLATLAALSDDELACVRDYVPWTRLLLPGPAVDPDGKAVSSLVARVAAEPSRFVLKRAWDYGGKTVFVGSHAHESGFAERARAAFGQPLDWPAVVAAASIDTRGGGFVVQQRVEVPLERHLIATERGLQEARLFVDYSAFCSVGLDTQPPWGGVVRASASPIVNILGGGGVLPVLTTEVATALDAALASRPQ